MMLHRVKLKKKIVFKIYVKLKFSLSNSSHNLLEHLVKSFKFFFSVLIPVKFLHSAYLEIDSINLTAYCAL